MRMWMVDPGMMCRKHLLGEHVECHMFLGCIRKGKSLQGYIVKGLVEVHHLKIRHDALAQEMFHRGYNHQTPFPADFHHSPVGHVDIRQSISDLMERCPECRWNRKRMY